ncbi:MAG: hypothetical protein WCV79_02815 [Candidatus Paceibacterota bacterium]
MIRYIIDVFEWNRTKPQTLLIKGTMSEETITNSKPWKLHIGCHRGTIVSRDSDVREHESLEACKGDVQKSEQFLAGLGYSIWFAKAIGPDGTEHRLHQGTPYR